MGHTAEYLTGSNRYLDMPDDLDDWDSQDWSRLIESRSYFYDWK